MKLVRSYLFAPGDDEALVGKALVSGADAVVLDLEDAVSSGRKAEAREIVQGTLRGDLPHGVDVWVRINPVTPSAADWREDVAAVAHPEAVAAGLAGLRLPKAESVHDVELVHDVLLTAEAQAGVAPRTVGLICAIESAVGLLNARHLAEHPRVTHLAFGATDFAADIGAEASEPSAMYYAQSRLVVTARAARIAPPITSVYTHLGDDVGLLRTTRMAKRQGFFGRSAIHASQLQAIHDVFTPDDDDIANARATVQACDEAGDGRGKMASTSSASGFFVDAVLAQRARALLDLHRRLSGKSKQ